MNSTSAGPVQCAIWARVSTADQHAENQLHVLREWAQRRGFEVVRTFIVEDSAWAVSKGNGNGAKGREFEKAREELLQGAHHGHYRAVLIWALDRLSRRGYEDLSPVLQQLRASQCDLLSHQEEWLTNLGPFGEVVIHMLSLWANQESERRSQRIKAGMATRRRNLEAGIEVKGAQRIGGRKPGAKDKRKRSREGYEAAWAPGGRLRVAREARLAAKRAAQVEQVSAIVSEAAESAANSTGSEEQ